MRLFLKEPQKLRVVAAPGSGLQFPSWVPIDSHHAVPSASHTVRLRRCDLIGLSTMTDSQRPIVWVEVLGRERCAP